MRSPRPRRKRCFRLFVLRSCRAQSRHLGLSPRSICEAPPEIPRQARDDSPSPPPSGPQIPLPRALNCGSSPKKRQNGRFSPFLIDFQPVFRVFRDFRSFRPFPLLFSCPIFLFSCQKSPSQAVPSPHLRPFASICGPNRRFQAVPRPPNAKIRPQMDANSRKWDFSDLRPAKNRSQAGKQDENHFFRFFGHPTSDFGPRTSGHSRPHSRHSPNS